MNYDIKAAVAKMNRTYGLPVNDVPTSQVGESPTKRLDGYLKTFQNEVNEGHDIFKSLESNGYPDEMDFLVDMADWLCDKLVYIYSELVKYGIDPDVVLPIIMASNESKLFDGKAVKDANGKFLKGPDYWKPEPKIRQALTQARYEEKSPITVSFLPGQPVWNKQTHEWMLFQEECMPFEFTCVRANGDIITVEQDHLSNHP